MFSSLSRSLTNIFSGLTRKGSLNERDVSAAMREIRLALLEADVALPVVNRFIAEVSAKAVGEAIARSVTPGQMVVKLVHDTLVGTLNGGLEDPSVLNMKAVAPVPIVLVGLQGVGKTTTAAKIGRFLQVKHKKRVIMASLDVYRPAAIDQLAALGSQFNVLTLPEVVGQNPNDIVRRAMHEAKAGGFDVLIFDTAGRTTIDDDMMEELVNVRDLSRPAETLLVADSMVGQDSVVTADAFNKRIGLTGIVLTRVDGDARGGAALSMREVTGVPIKLMGVGEKVDDIEAFDAKRVAGRILGMGDVVGLVEKAQSAFSEEETERLESRMSRGVFDLNDFLAQLKQLQKMGGMKEMLNMLPGISKMGKQVSDQNLDPMVIKRQEAIVTSMTILERAKPALIKASRKKRIAKGSGVTVSDVNKLLKQYIQMSTMMKRVKKKGMPAMLSELMPGSNTPVKAPPNQLLRRR
ncbi:MAG: signal recognition particle protein [Rhodospirillaceae bacterium]|nr:signal recognition particle protein [Rhodospirillaceae bacterium]